MYPTLLITSLPTWLKDDILSSQHVNKHNPSTLYTITKLKIPAPLYVNISRQVSELNILPKHNILDSQYKS